MARTSSVSCSSHATVCYSMEQAVSMVMDDQSLNILLAVTAVQFEIFFVDFIMSEL